MSVQFEIISSGSQGNAVVIEGGILIDCGVAFKALQTHLSKLKVILLTHKHGDHFNKSTIARLAKERPDLRFSCGEFLAKDLLSCGVKANKIDIAKIGKMLDYRNFTAEAFILEHDVPNVGWKIHCNGNRIFYATDTATLDDVQAKKYDLYLIEGNHGEREIAERIRKKNANGQFCHEERAAKMHLSKEQADDFLARNAGANSEYFYLHESKSEVKDV
jgi:L-ascorbate metabolism protein UlaG (beta-lactamase superfamily)